MVGRTLGHYRLLEEIGAGGMGVVYLAHDPRLDRQVAVKVLSPAYQSAEHRRRFQKEARALSRLNHPNIATIHDFESADGVDLLVMEYIPGNSLDARLRDGPLPQPDLVHLGTQLVQALSAAHDYGVIHGDLKPSNVRVTPDGRVKILDFGLARRLATPDAVTRTATGDHVFAGTLPYMAPEQLTGLPTGVATDVYAAGAVLYEMATGRPPFLAASPPLLIDAILHQDPAPMTEQSVSPGVDRVIRKALERSPSDRYATARELLTDFERAQQGGRPVPGRRRGLAGHRAGALAAAAAAVILTGVGAWYRYATSLPAEAFTPRDWALVSDFESVSGDPRLARVARQSFLFALEQSAYVNVVPDAHVAEALARMKRQDRPPVQGEVALEICRRENARVLLAGALQQSGTAIQIAVRVVNPADGSVLSTVYEDLSTPNDVFGAADQLAKRVRRELGESLDRIQQAEPVARVTTASFSALEQYTGAAEAMNRGAFEEAAALLKGALSLDPDFAMAHSLLADVYLTLGDRQKQKAHVDKAYSLRAALTLRERYAIEATYFGVHERYDEQSERLRALTALYPDDPTAHAQLAQALSNIMDMRGAIAAAREQNRISGNRIGSHEKLLDLLTQQGHDEEALRLYDSVTKTLGVTPRLRWAAGMARFGLGQLAESRSVFEDLAAGEEPSYASIGRLYLARIDAYEGRFARALAALADDIQEDERRGYVAAELTRRYLAGRMHLVNGDREAARREADLIVAVGDDLIQAGHLLHAAILHARGGDARQARLTLGRAEALAQRAPSSFTRGIADSIAGEIALAAGDAAGAEESFKRAWREYPGYLAQQGLAEALGARRDWKGSSAAWERVIDARGEILRNGFSADWVLALIHASRAYARAGDVATARAHLARAASAWRDADPQGPGALLAKAGADLGSGGQADRGPVGSPSSGGQR